MPVLEQRFLQYNQVTVHECKTNSASVEDHPFGPVVSGHLRLTAAIISDTVECDAPSFRFIVKATTETRSLA
jgi:hypothetical protein